VRDYYFLYKLDNLFWIYILLLIVLKVVFAFAGQMLKKIEWAYFCTDLLLTYVCVIGAFFQLSNYLNTQYIYHGHYLFIFIFTLWVNAFAFLVSTIYKNRDGIYNPFIGIILMEVTTILMVLYIKSKLSIMTMTETKYLVTIGAISIVNIYICINSYLM